jgi:hypothetical protein
MPKLSAMVICTLLTNLRFQNDSKNAFATRLSRARAFSWSRFQPAFATPMTGTSRRPRFSIDCSDGKIFL